MDRPRFETGDKVKVIGGENSLIDNLVGTIEEWGYMNSSLVYVVYFADIDRSYFINEYDLESHNGTESNG